MQYLGVLKKKLEVKVHRVRTGVVANASGEVNLREIQRHRKLKQKMLPVWSVV